MKSTARNRVIFGSCPQHPNDKKSFRRKNRSCSRIRNQECFQTANADHFCRRIGDRLGSIGFRNPNELAAGCFHSIRLLVRNLFHCGRSVMVDSSRISHQPADYMGVLCFVYPAFLSGRCEKQNRVRSLSKWSSERHSKVKFSSLSTRQPLSARALNESLRSELESRLMRFLAKLSANESWVEVGMDFHSI